MQQEARDLVNLILSDYQMRLNSKQATKDGLKSSDMQALIDNVFEDTSLADHLEPLARLLLIKNDRVAKQIIKAIQRCMFQF